MPLARPSGRGSTCTARLSIGAVTTFVTGPRVRSHHEDHNHHRRDQSLDTRLLSQPSIVAWPPELPLMAPDTIESQLQDLREQVDLHAEAISRLVELVSNLDGIDGPLLSSYVLRMKTLRTPAAAAAATSEPRVDAASPTGTGWGVASTAVSGSVDGDFRGSDSLDR